MAEQVIMDPFYCSVNCTSDWQGFKVMLMLQTLILMMNTMEQYILITQFLVCFVDWGTMWVI